MLILTYLVLGVFVGVFAGLFGVGGGTIIVPVLILTFAAQQLPDSVATHLAIGTSLASITLTSLSSAYTHYRAGAVVKQALLSLVPGICIGVWTGSIVAALLAGTSLQSLFGLFALLIAVQMGFDWQPGRNTSTPQLPGGFVMTGAGGIIGFISALFGIGGGALTVPFLTWNGVRMQHAVGTAAACGFPIALVGAAGYAWQGWHHADLPDWSTGFVYWPALLGITVSSMVFARVGANLAHRLPAPVLRRIFAGFLALIGTGFLFGARISALFSGLS